MPILSVGLVCFGFPAINRLMYFKLFLEENISTNTNREEIVNEVTELQHQICIFINVLENLSPKKPNANQRCGYAIFERKQNSRERNM